MLRHKGKSHLRCRWLARGDSDEWISLLHDFDCYDDRDHDLKPCYNLFFFCCSIDLDVILLLFNENIHLWIPKGKRKKEKGKGKR